MMTMPLELKTIPEECSIFTPNVEIPTVNFFMSKMPIALWRYQLYLFQNLSNLSFNFKLILTLNSQI